MYKSVQMYITKQSNPVFFDYFYQNACLAKNLYNASLFRVRQTFTASMKSSLTTNEQEIVDEQALVCSTLGCKSQTVLTYHRLEKMLRLTHNPDYFAGLPMQSAEAIVKIVASKFCEWLKAKKDYKKNPSKYTGEPKMPKYKKQDIMILEYTNQDVIIYDNGIKFPKIKTRLVVSNLKPSDSLKQVLVKPFYDGFMVCFVIDVETALSMHSMPNCASIDLGVDNLAALVTNEGHTYLYKGGIIKSINQYYNKQKAHYTSVLQSQTQEEAVSSKQLTTLNRKRYFQLKDYFHKVSKDIINKCVRHHVGTLVIGENKQWKQNVNIGKVNNQTFVSIPFDMLKKQLKYKAEQIGIQVIFQEESYTSKADFLSNDNIPSLGDMKTSFSGKRKGRGLYQSGTGIILNADINGACNILRKYDIHAFDGVSDFQYLQRPIVLSNLYT
jgi:putative transposase